MYLPAHFEETRLDVLHALMRARPLATLVTLSPSGLNADHIPMHLSGEPAPLGTLRGHVARANPMWKEFDREVEALAVFHGPEAYITPSWYPAKVESGRVVPTWNYAVVHARGMVRVVDDAAWLRAHLEALTAQNEASLSAPWQVSDAPREFTDKLIAAVVGIEIVIQRLSGKWKVSQNQPARNRAGVVRGLRETGSEGSAEIAELVAEAARPSDGE